MSWKIFEMVRKRELGTILRKALLMSLADTAKPDGTGIWKSKGTLAAELCCTRVAIFKAMGQFEREGIIRRVRVRKCRHGSVIEYALNLDVIRALPEIGISEPDELTPFTGKRGEPVNAANAGDKLDLPKPSLNHSEAKASGRDAPDPVEGIFDLGVSLLHKHGMREREARSLLGKWRKQRGDREVLAALKECRTEAVSSPAEWLMKRLAPRSVTNFRIFSSQAYTVPNLPALPTRDQADPAEVAAIARHASEVLAAGGPVCVR